MYSPDAIQVERTWVLPSDSAIGRGVYNPQYGDGSGGAGGGYLAYYISKATTTPYPIALAISGGGIVPAQLSVSVTNAGFFVQTFQSPVVVKSPEETRGPESPEAKAEVFSP